MIPPSTKNLSTAKARIRAAVRRRAAAVLDHTDPMLLAHHDLVTGFDDPTDEQFAGLLRFALTERNRVSARLRSGAAIGPLGTRPTPKKRGRK